MKRVLSLFDVARSLRLVASLVGLGLLVGCQSSVESQLVGSWRGTPDSAAAAAARDSKAKAAANKDSGAGPADAPLVEDDPETEQQPTDLEAVDVTIDLTFDDEGAVAMSRVGGETYNGVWRVIERIPPQGAEIEISRLADGAKAEGEEAKPKIPEKRRFTIEFEKDGENEGFLLKEKGADPQFGRLYFRRVE